MDLEMKETTTDQEDVIEACSAIIIVRPDEDADIFEYSRIDGEEDMIMHPQEEDADEDDHQEQQGKEFVPTNSDNKNDEAENVVGSGQSDNEYDQIENMNENRDVVEVLVRQHNTTNHDTHFENETSLPLPVTTTETDIDNKDKRMLQALLSSLEDLQRKIDEVIAFPTATNFKKMHHQASSAHRSYIQLSQSIEFGNIIHNNHDDDDNEHSTHDDNDIVCDEIRAKLTSFGTNIWLNIQNNPNVFRDSISYSTSTTLNDAPQDHCHKNNIRSANDNESTMRKEEKLLEIERAAASGYIRSLACRLILISKIRTKALTVPSLIEKEELVIPEEKDSSRGGSSADKNALSLPVASNGELEFTFKCLYRAGKSMMNHSSPTQIELSSLPQGYDPSAAYSTLSLALVFWRGMEHVHRTKNDRGKKCLFVEEAFDVMLLIPDSAKLFCMKNDDDGTGSSEWSKDEVASLILQQLTYLEEFVKNQIPIDVDENKSMNNKSLKSIQRYLPSLARVSFKHGNHLARVFEYDSSRKALRIAIDATDNCISMIRASLKSSGDCHNEEHPNMKRSLQIQEEEMLVLSKQCLYVLCNVYKSLGETNEAKKCLDRVEVYINNQRNKDDEQYKETMKRINKSNTQNAESLSEFALEGPKKQDIAEIKARLMVARKKSKYGISMERLNISYSRIMIALDQTTAPETTKETKERESYFRSIVELINNIESEYKFGKSSLGSSHTCPIKRKDAMRLALSAARSMYLHVKDKFNNDEFENPYDLLFTKFPKGDDEYVLIQLEYLNTLLIEAKDVREYATQDSKKMCSYVDGCALELGKQLVSHLIASLNDLCREQTNNFRQDSTLFTRTKAMPKSNLIQVLQDSREYFTRALSLYYSSVQEYNVAIEWCNLLMEILRVSQQFAFMKSEDAFDQDSLDAVISEIMATKALSLSMTKCHGTALKTAREAWDKQGTEIGNLVTLFHCSVQYEANSYVEDHCTSKGSFDNSFFELDSSISNYLSIPTTNDLSGKNIHSLLEAFPVMLNTSLQIGKNETGPLSLGLQRRYVGFLVDFIAIKFTQNVWKVEDTEGLDDNIIPGENNVFNVLCSLLVNVDTALTSKDTDDVKWQLEQLQHVQKSLEKVLKLLTLSRDQFGKLDKSAELVLVLENKLLTKVIGNSSDCLWIAEQLWNLAILVATKDVSNNEDVESPLLYAAQFFSMAHDFALLSEEECGNFLTKGHLSCENFDDTDFKQNPIDFTFQANFESTDICSEFSAQCLVLSVRHVVDHVLRIVLPQQSDLKNILSKEHYPLLDCSMRRCVALMAQIQTLGEDMNEKVTEQVKWLILPLLILLRDDNFCSTVLIQYGLLECLKSDLVKTIESREVHSLESILQFIPLAENMDMTESAKHLLNLCTQFVSRQSLTTNKGLSQRFSIGIMQRKVVKLASKVNEIVSVFNAIDEQVRNDTNVKSTPTSDFNAKKEVGLYTMDDIDYFAIEAYNRAISLLYIGDFLNAEKLLTVALNLLPHCGKEVVSHGSEIRKVYRGVIQRRNVESDGLSMMSDSMITLFEG